MLLLHYLSTGLDYMAIPPYCCGLQRICFYCGCYCSLNIKCNRYLFDTKEKLTDSKKIIFFHLKK